MAGSSMNQGYVEKISPFLQKKMEQIKSEFGENSKEYLALARQYVKSEKETLHEEEHNRRHWEADVHVKLNEKVETLHGMERLYHRTIVVEPTMACMSHCRYCLRGNYEIFNLTKDELEAIAAYCGTTGASSGLEEILITGGDPLLAADLVSFFVDQIIEKAPNIRIIRIATRLLTHAPELIDDKVFSILDKASGTLRFEIATQINHPVEFFPETIEKIRQLQKRGAHIYSQNVLLKGVNDDADTLIQLYLLMRRYGLEAHYLFHCVPMQGMHHFRTSVQKGLELAKQLSNSGCLSGRAKPMYALMTDVGKVTLYDGVILGKEGHFLNLKTEYKFAERLAWNPSWQLPDTAFVTEDGYIGIHYLDGTDDE